MSIGSAILAELIKEAAAHADTIMALEEIIDLCYNPPSYELLHQLTGLVTKLPEQLGFSITDSSDLQKLWKDYVYELVELGDPSVETWEGTLRSLARNCFFTKERVESAQEYDNKKVARFVSDLNGK